MAHPLMFWDNAFQLYLNGHRTKDSAHFRAIFAGLCIASIDVKASFNFAFERMLPKENLFLLGESI